MKIKLNDGTEIEGDLNELLEALKVLKGFNGKSKKADTTFDFLREIPTSTPSIKGKKRYKHYKKSNKIINFKNKFEKMVNFIENSKKLRALPYYYSKFFKGNPSKTAYINLKNYTKQNNNLFKYNNGKFELYCGSQFKEKALRKFERKNKIKKEFISHQEKKKYKKGNEEYRKFMKEKLLKYTKQGIFHTDAFRMGVNDWNKFKHSGQKYPSSKTSYDNSIKINIDEDVLKGILSHLKINHKFDYMDYIAIYPDNDEENYRELIRDIIFNAGKIEQKFNLSRKLFIDNGILTFKD